MATVNLGRIKPIFKGAYAGGTAYVVDDIVTSGNETFICIQASTGNATSNASYWTKLAAKGTDGTDVGTTITTQGDILYRDGSGLQRLAKGTAAQSLVMNSGATAPEWGTVSSGTYSVHAIDSYNYQTQVVTTSTADYHDIAGGNTVQFQPTHVDDFIYIAHSNSFYTGIAGSGVDYYMMMKAGSSAITSADTVLNYDGSHANYITSSGYYAILHKSFLLPCTGLSTSTIYYLEQAGATHSVNNTEHNDSSAQASGSYRAHNVNLIHYKKN